MKYVMKFFTKGNNNIDELNNSVSSNNNYSQFNIQRKQRITPPNIYINPNLQTNIKELKLINSLNLSQSTCTITLAFSQNNMNDILNNIDNELLNIINNLSNISILFLLFIVSNDKEEQDIKDCVINLFPNFPIHRVIFYLGTVGKIAIVRQIKPVIHIDFDTTVCESLNPHVRSVIEMNQSSSINTKKSNWREIINLNDLYDITLK